ncbi:hypothetical protein MKZ38_010589 [Zalerion maritima]|uniref:Uncharacterized protein n=1 Tax=Zalerion maritima TaxID=339359 RepID=A0AAD5RFD2_9PEZI|nr:hypothetical protein MKZ38_010589 [Zalerion maritima]
MDPPMRGVAPSFGEGGETGTTRGRSASGGGVVGGPAFSEYSAVSQSDDEMRNGSSPTTSPSPIDSPVPFLSIAEKALTPMSMDSSDLDFAGKVDEKGTYRRIRSGDDNRSNTGLDEPAGEAHDMHGNQQQQKQAGKDNGDNDQRNFPSDIAAGHHCAAVISDSNVTSSGGANATPTTATETPAKTITNPPLTRYRPLSVATVSNATADALSEAADSTIRARKHRSSRGVTQIFQQQELEEVQSPLVDAAGSFNHSTQDNSIQSSRSHQTQTLDATGNPTTADEGAFKSGILPSIRPSRLRVGAHAPRLTTASIDTALSGFNTTAGPHSPSSPVSPISPRSCIHRKQHKQEHLHRFPDLDTSDINDFHNDNNRLLLDSDLIPDPLQPQPIVRTASNSTVSLCHPTPDLNTRSGAYIGNVAALEATAERLSMTSSIDDAIRALHRDIKRSESRRSSILQSNLSPFNASPSTAPTRPSLSRQLSAASSIVNTNNAARQGGYSPGGYILSPNHSLTGSRRLRSGSRGSRSSKNDEDYHSSSYSSGFLSRTGPGKGSQHSVRSSKPSLSEIVEMENPVSLNSSAMEEADRAIDTDFNVDFNMDFNTGFDVTKGANIPIMNMTHIAQERQEMPPPPPPHREGTLQQQQPQQYTQEQNTGRSKESDDRPTTAASTTTFEQAQRAFGDFDGVHCLPESQPNSPPLDPMPDFPDLSRTSHGSFSRNAPLRPTSYVDPESGSQMMYYPARVPAMLNLPPKLGKGGKSGAVRNERRSQVLSQMTEQNRVSAIEPDRGSVIWLPDPLEGHAPTPFFPDKAEPHPDMMSNSDVNTIKDSQLDVSTPSADSGSAPGSAPLDSPAKVPGTGFAPSHSRESSAMGAIPNAVPRPRLRQVDQDARRSRMSTNINNLPSQLRASAYFDLPSEIPTIEIKDGSAMATLDSILDASADAPVSAFTDHAFAGKLGSEVYGREKKRKSFSHTKTLSTNSLGNKSRLSFLGLGKHGDKHGSDEDSDRRHTIMSGSQGLGDNESQHLPDHIDEKGSDESDEAGEADQEYDGPPTTLLAELQIRKQQQKQRTRKLNGVNGLHATLLEMDAVAEQERKTRKQRKVNLAWEEARSDHDSEEDDVPLGVLYAAKAMSTNDLNAAAAEVNRPLGLMEKRDIEDNEPLARRRVRLQGGNPNARASQFTLSPQFPQVDIPDDDEEDEPLAARQRRLKSDSDDLPRARPVSAAFSSELLSQFGDGDEKQDPYRKGDNTTPTEETLGQRRRRLQTEREASSGSFSGIKKMSSMANVLGAYGGSGNRLSAMPNNLNLRASGYLGDLGPASTPMPTSDPRASERARLENDARLVREQEEKMRMMRNMMPQSLEGPSHTNRASAYLGGAFNDGTGGTGISRRVMYDPRSGERARAEEQDRVVREQQERMKGMRAQMPTEMPSLQRKPSGYMGGMFNDGTGGLISTVQQQQQSHMQQEQRQSMFVQGGLVNPGPGMGGGGYAASNMGMGGMGGMGMNMPMNMNMGMQMPMGGSGGMATPMGMGMQAPIGGGMQLPAAGPQEMDRVEMWRRSVMQ